MTEQVEVKIPFTDLTRVTLECPNCESEMSFDLLSKYSASIDKCHGCGSVMDSKFSEAFTHLRKCQASLNGSQIADKMFFRIKKQTALP